MTGLGTPPPPELGDDRPLIAGWYAAEILEHARVGGHPGTSCRVIDDLCSGAIAAGVYAVDVLSEDRRRMMPLHEVMAPYRRTPGGYRETSDRELRAVLDDPRVPRGRLLGRHLQNVTRHGQMRRQQRGLVVEGGEG